MKKYWKVINLNKRYFLKVGNKTYNCQVGSGGLQNVAKKVEGDNTTPTGKWVLNTIYYRPDRVLRPKFKKKNILKIKKITKNCGWCDDIRCHYYNKYIRIDNVRSSDINYEKLWRDDEAYDILIVISHNIQPTIRNKGSAIFIHCSFFDNRNTGGCIALNKKDLIFLIHKLKSKILIKIPN